MTETETLTQPVVTISDDGKDLDDEVAKILMNSLESRDLVECCGYIANLAPAVDRARLARGTLDLLGMSTPVFVGHEMLDKPKVTPYEFDVPYIAKEEQIDRATKGIDGLAGILRTLQERNVTLVCLSGLTDAWALFVEHRDLFKSKIGRVVIMGGVEVDEANNVKRDEAGLMIPDKAQNNTFDMDA